MRPPMSPKAYGMGETDRDVEKVAGLEPIIEKWESGEYF